MSTVTKQHPKKIQQIQRMMILIILVTVFVCLNLFVPAEAFELSYLQRHLADLKALVNENLPISLIIYITGYALLTGISFPGATVFTILAGALFGFKIGFVAALMGSTLGATMACIIVRFLFNDFFSRKFYQQAKVINREFKENGNAYLLTLRLVPLFPFFLVNLLMGLTPIKISSFFKLTFLGMVPAIAVYTFAGLSFSTITSVRSIASPPMLITLTLVGLLPITSKYLMEWIRCHKLYRPYQKPKDISYNIIVIGGGSAGLVTAYVAASMGAKVALIEQNKMGGDCLNSGCVPSKTLIKSADVSFQLKNSAQFGIEHQTIKINFKNVMKNIHQTIEAIAPHDSVARYKSLGVDCFQSSAKIISPWEVQIDKEIITAQNIVIASGASPKTISIPGLDTITPLNSENVWNLHELPANFLIIGGGAIGIELAQSFSRLGSRVTIVESGAGILGSEDPMVSDTIFKVLINEGVNIFLNTKLLRFESGLAFFSNEHSHEEQIAFDQVFFALGRQANTSGFGLEDLKVVLCENKSVKINKYLQTNYPNIYACGDVSGSFQFTHFAAHQAKTVAINCLFGQFKKLKNIESFVPRCIYSHPEVASVGATSSQLANSDIAYDETLFSLAELDRAIIEKEQTGFVKILTAKNSSKILGVTIVSQNATLMIQEFVLAMENNLSLNKILNSIHPYPGFGEANKYAAGVWKKQSVSPKVLVFFGKFLKFGLKK